MIAPFDCDDEESPEAARATRQAAAFKGGKLTEAGATAIKQWADSELIEDRTASLGALELRQAFNEATDGFEIGFQSLYDVLYDCVNEDIRPTRATASPGEFVAGAFPQLPLRFRDDLGAASFFASGVKPAVDYLVDGILPLRGVNMFVSLPETMKTWAALDIGVCVSQGKPWLGKYETKQTRVVFVNFEMDPEELDRRLLLLGADDRFQYVSYPPYDLSSPKFWTEIAKLQAGLIVIDSLSRGNGVELGELDSRFAAPLYRAGRYVSEHARQWYVGREFCSFLFVHHSPKGASLKDVESLFRGTGAIRGGVDSAFYFEKVKAEASVSQARVTNVKARKGSKPEPFSIQLTDSRGLELVDDRTPKAAAPVAGDEERLFAFVQKNPGTNATHAAAKLHMRPATVAAVRKALGGRMRVEGKGPATRLFAVD